LYFFASTINHVTVIIVECLKSKKRFLSYERNDYF